MRGLRSFLEVAFNKPETRTFIVVNDTLAFLTLLSVLAIILETIDSLEIYKDIFNLIEYTAVAFFTLEYFGRAYIERVKFHYFFSFFGIIDLLAIVPTYVGFTNFTYLKTTRVLRILRFLRIVRLSKLARLGKERVKDIENYADLYRMNLKIYFFALFSTVVIFGSLLYIFEGHQAGAASIPFGMIWAAKVIMGGVAQFMPTTIWGDITIIITRFVGTLLVMRDMQDDRFRQSYFLHQEQ